MKISITKKVGNTSLVFQVDETKDIDALFQAGSIASMPTVCGHCESEDVRFTSNKAEGYTFVKVRCNKCNYSANVGQYKDGGFFWKEFEAYVPKDSESKQLKQKTGITDDDLAEIFPPDESDY
jgi:hypothetical protein